jgi:Protein of unknown function (DUF5672)
MQLNSCHHHKTLENQSALLRICGEILTTPLAKKPQSNEFCAVFVDGRDREINCCEDYAAFYSFNIASQCNYPIFAFVANTENFLHNNQSLINDLRINVIKINPLKNLNEYSYFVINNVFYHLGVCKYAITIQPDGFFTGKQGWEDYALSTKVPFLGARWLHHAFVIGKTQDNQWARFSNKSTCFCNGAFSFRDIDVMKNIASTYSHLTLAEYGDPNNTYPKEDLFFGHFLYNVENFTPPTIEQCNKFSLDPIDIQEFTNKESFGFHYPKIVNEHKHYRENNSFIF